MSLPLSGSWQLCPPYPSVRVHPSCPIVFCLPGTQQPYLATMFWKSILTFFFQDGLKHKQPWTVVIRAPGPISSIRPSSFPQRGWRVSGEAWSQAFTCLRGGEDKWASLELRWDCLCLCCWSHDPPSLFHNLGPRSQLYLTLQEVYSLQVKCWLNRHSHATVSGSH